MRYATRSDDGWQVEQEFLPYGDNPAIAVGPDGRLHLAYADVSTTSGQLRIYYCSHDSQGWSLPRLIADTPSPFPADDPAIASLGAVVHVVWTERVQAHNQLVHARSTSAGIFWDSVIPIPEAFGYAPALASGPGGSLWLAWQGEPDEGVGQTSEIYVSQWNGFSWSAPENVSQSPTTYSRAPDLLLTGFDQVHVTWEEEDADETLSIHYRSYTDGAWSAPTPVSQEGGGQPSMAYSASGGLHIAWDAGESVHLRTLSTDASWGTVTSIAYAAGGVRDVALTVDGAGRLWAAWSARMDSEVWTLVSSAQGSMATATPTHSPTMTDTTTATASLTPTVVLTVTASIIESSTPTASATGTLTKTETATPTAYPTSTVTETAAPTATLTLTPEPPTPSPPFPPSICIPVVLASGAASPTVSLLPETHSLKLSEPAAREQEEPGPLGGWEWGTPQNVSRSANTSHEPALARTEDGRVFAVWAEPYLGYDMLHYSICVGGAWSQPTRFWAGSEPSLAVGPDDKLHLAYSDEFGGNYDIYYSYWTGSGWWPGENVSSTSGNSGQPVVTVKEDGTVIIIWTDTTEGYNRLYYGWQTGGFWSTFVIDDTIDGSAPDLATGKDGRLWVVWQAPESSDAYDVYVKHGNGISWPGLAVNLSDSEDQDSLAPRIAGSADLGAFVVWQEEADAADVYYAGNEGGIFAWSLPEDLSQSAVRSEQPAITLDVTARLYVAWSEADALAIRPRYVGSAWSSAEILTNGESGFGEIALVSDPLRRLHLAWSEPRGAAQRDIFYRRGGRILDQTLWLPLVISQWVSSSAHSLEMDQ